MVENCTPGDWHTTGHPEGMEFEIRAGDLYVGAASWGVEGIDDAPTFSQARANAHMFAASKRLYEALKWFIDDIDGTHTVMVDFDANVEAARKALAAARGEQS